MKVLISFAILTGQPGATNLGRIASLLKQTRVNHETLIWSAPTGRIPTKLWMIAEAGESQIIDFGQRIQAAGDFTDLTLEIFDQQGRLQSMRGSVS